MTAGAGVAGIGEADFLGATAVEIPSAVAFVGSAIVALCRTGHLAGVVKELSIVTLFTSAAGVAGIGEANLLGVAAIEIPGALARGSRAVVSLCGPGHLTSIVKHKDAGKVVSFAGAASVAGIGEADLLGAAAVEIPSALACGSRTIEALCRPDDLAGIVEGPDRVALFAGAAGVFGAGEADFLGAAAVEIPSALAWKEARRCSAVVPTTCPALLRNRAKLFCSPVLLVWPASVRPISWVLLPLKYQVL